MSIRFVRSTAALALIAGLALPAAAQLSTSGSGAFRAPASTKSLDAKVEPAQTTFWLHVLHNNDGESRLLNAGGSQSAFGGIARYKTLTDSMRTFAETYPPGKAERAVVKISSGDNFLAGPQFAASLARGIPYYDAVGMQLIGYDAVTVGNHEFDFGPDILRNFIASFSDSTPFITANLGFANEPGLLALQNAGRLVNSTIIQAGSRRVGVIGATTTDLPFISSPRNTIVSAVRPAIEAEITRLTNEGVNIIILSTHLQSLQQEFTLAAQLRNVDLIIGGGGSELLADPDTLLVPGDTRFTTDIGGTGYPRTAIDADGRNVPLVTTAGLYKYVGRLIVGFDDAGNITAVDPISEPVRVSSVAPDAVAADPAVQSQVVEPVAAYVAAQAANIIAINQVPLNGIRNDVRTRETNLGNLTADALLWAGVTLAPTFGLPTPDVALQNSGGLRNETIIPVGNFTELNTFEMLPFANFVSIVPTVPASQFKEILENAVSRVETIQGRFAQVAGFRFTWNAAGVAQVVDNNGNVTTPGTRVRDVILNDGRVIVRNGLVVPGAPAVNIATIDFLARGGDQYPFRGRPFATLGVTYQLSLQRYIETQLGRVIRAQDYPAGGEGRITRQN